LLAPVDAAGYHWPEPPSRAAGSAPFLKVNRLPWVNRLAGDARLIYMYASLRMMRDARREEPMSNHGGWEELASESRPRGLAA